MFRIIFLLLLSINAYALDGIEYIAGAKYPKIVIEHHPKGFACGFLYQVDGFGSAHKVINDLLSTGKCTVTRIHLSWKDSHSFNDADIAVVVKKAKKLNNLVKKYPNVKFYVSGWLEHRANLQLITKLKKEILKVMDPRVKYVNSFISGGAYLPATINEVHHTFSTPRGDYIYSWDGLEMMDSDVQKYNDTHKNALIRFRWGGRTNCKLEYDDTTKRPDRTMEACPDEKYLRSIIAYSEPRKIAKKKEIPRDWIYKSHGEAEFDRNGKLLSRSEKPVWIIPVKASNVTLKAKKKVMAIFDYEKPYSDKPGYHVYRTKYNPLYGYEIAEKICKLKKKANANVWLGKKRYRKVINPIYRDGSYKND